MKKLFTILFLCFLATSCSKKLSPGINSVIKETVTSDTVYIQKDSLIVLPADRVVIHDIIPCPDVEYHKEATSNSGRTKAIVDIKKGNLFIDCKTDSLEARIKWLEAHSTTIKNFTKETTITLPPKRYIPKWVWWFVGLTVLYFLLKFMLQYFKIPIRI